MQKPKTGGGGTYFAPFKGRTWIARPDQARVKLENVGEASRKVTTCLQKDILKNSTPERATLAVSTLARTGFSSSSSAPSSRRVGGWGIHRVSIGMHLHEIGRAHLAPGGRDLVTGRAHPPFVRPRIANERIAIGNERIDMAV